MKHMKIQSILKDKGFYIALAVCLVAVGVVAVVSLSALLPTEEAGESTPTTVPQPTATTGQPVQNPVTNIADLRTTVPTTAPTTAAPTEAPAPDPLYVLPLSNEVSRPFSDKEPLYSPTMEDWRTHTGTDFTGKAGQEVKAAAAGKVTAIREDVMWGPLVEIDHGFGIVSRYAGVSARNIAVGDRVEVGESIGVLATVPCEAAEGAHLHLELLSGGKPLDPVTVIGVEVRYKK